MADYELDEEDGLSRELVGAWAVEKHARLKRYVDISRSVRRDFIGSGKAGATLVDLFCGPGRARIRNEQTVIDGSAVLAWREAHNSSTPFSRIFLGDSSAEMLSACEQRLMKLAAPVSAFQGPAAETVDQIITKLDPYGLNLAFLDPYNLGSLDFEIIRKLASFRRIDIVIHVSSQDLQRNLGKYLDPNDKILETFAPGWRNQVDSNRNHQAIRAQLFEYWRRLVLDLGMDISETHEQVRGERNQPLYLLAFAAKNAKATEFWNKIRDIDPNRQGSLFG